MSRMPLSTELGLVAFVLLFPMWMIDPITYPFTVITVMLVQMAACIGSFIARKKENAAHRANVRAMIEKIKKKREGK